MRAKQPHHGCYSRNFPRALREFVEVDYLHKLNDDERAWLAKFNDEQAGCFRKNPLHTEQEQQREIWRNVRALKLDAHAEARGSVVDLEIVIQPDRDWLEPKEDLLHAHAVANLRAELPPLPKKAHCRVTVTKAHRAALARLVDINQRQLAGLKR